MALVPVWRKGDVVGHAVVDDDLLPSVAGYRWLLNSQGYAVRYVATRAILLHREVLGLTAGDRTQGDHVNRDRLDNRRSNLRAVDPSANKQNVTSHRGSSSKYRGVYWESTERCWRAAIVVQGRKKHLGRFHDEDAAGRAAAHARARLMPFSAEAAA